MLKIHRIGTFGWLTFRAIALLGLKRELVVFLECLSAVPDKICPLALIKRPEQPQPSRGGFKRTEEYLWSSHEIKKNKFVVTTLSGSIQTSPEEFENGAFTQRIKKYFPSTSRRRNLKTEHSPFILDTCLRKTLSGKSRDYHDVIVCGKLRFQKVFRPQ